MRHPITRLFISALLFALVATGCEQFDGRYQSGVCYKHEHQSDNTNCGCSGPCMEGEACEGGVCVYASGSSGRAPFDVANRTDLTRGLWADSLQSEEAELFLHENVLIVEETEGVQVVSGPQGGMLEMALSSPDLLKPGTVVVSATTDTPFAVRVDELSSYGSTYLAKVSEPRLDQIISRCKLVEHLHLDYGGVEFSGQLSASVTPRAWTPKSDELSFDAFEVPLTGLLPISSTLIDQNGNSAEVQVKIKSGAIVVRPSFLFELEVSDEGVQHLLVASKVDFELDVVLGFQLTGKLSMFTHESGELLGLRHTIVTSVWPPVWVDVGARLTWVTDLDFEGSLQADVGGQLHFESLFGASYEQGNWTKLSDFPPPSTEPLANDWDALLGFELKTGPKLAFFVEPYSVMGPALFGRLFGGGNGRIAANPLRLVVDVLFGIEAGVEFNVELFGWELAKFVKKVFEWQTVIASAEVPLSCTPECNGDACGDGGCPEQPNACGLCGDGQSCQSGECVDGPCLPGCSGKECGPDGCGSSCGDCDPGYTCNEPEGICVKEACEPACAGEDCGDGGCPEQPNACGLCGENQSCQSGECVDGPCLPNCPGKECGPDGCDGSCGDCSQGYTCNQSTGQCKEDVCVPACDGKECGDDGCNGTCGDCGPSETCSEDQLNASCVCTTCVVGKSLCENGAVVVCIETSPDSICGKWAQADCPAGKYCSTESGDAECKDKCAGDFICNWEENLGACDSGTCSSEFGCAFNVGYTYVGTQYHISIAVWDKDPTPPDDLLFHQCEPLSPGSFDYLVLGMATIDWTEAGTWEVEDEPEMYVVVKLYGSGGCLAQPMSNETMDLGIALDAKTFGPYSPGINADSCECL